MKRLKRAIALPLVALLLFGCDGGGPGEFDRMVTGIVGGGGGGASRAIPQQAPATNVPATGASKMLQNPDAAGVEDGIEVRADSLTEANNQCQAQAERLTNSTAVVSCLGCRIRTMTTGKYVCTLKTEWL